MTAQEVLKTVAEMPQEDLMMIQVGIADLIAQRFSPEEIAEIQSALAESEAQFNRGEGIDSETLRRQLGL
jgi:DNA-binding FadR family transcriptional regulator